MMPASPARDDYEHLTQSEPNGLGSLHTIQPGETLSRVAGKYGLNTTALVKINLAINPDFNPFVVLPGEQIVIPNPGRPEPPMPPAGQHVVQPGDSWLSIAAYYGISLPHLYRLNQVVNPGLMPSTVTLFAE